MSLVLRKRFCVQGLKQYMETWQGSGGKKSGQGVKYQSQVMTGSHAGAMAAPSSPGGVQVTFLVQSLAL